MKIAFVFPGQGSQTVGMLAGFAGNAVVEQTIARASAALGEDLAGLMANGPAEQLNLTTNTQPVMLAASVAFYEAWKAAGGPAPALVAGHSLGVYAALIAVDALTCVHAERLVRFRAVDMYDAVPLGEVGMATIIGIVDDTVRAVCAAAEKDQVLEAANYNAPSQVVIAGHKQAVER